MPNPLNLAQGALDQPRPLVLYGEVARPAPASFTALLYVNAPQWRTDTYWAIFTHWPKCHGNTLPAVGNPVTMVLDTKGAYRVVGWDGPNT